MRLSRSTEPGEVLFNLVALILLTAGVVSAAQLKNDPGLAREWWFWVFVAGPVAFWSAVVTILVRLVRSGHRPRLRFRRGLSITGSRECYRVYEARFGRGVLAWLIVAPVWTVLSLFLIAVVQ